ncbi:hypothetical protein PRUPE_4G001000 [Prunus persica]|uniref:RING-type domain-containing protein n=2 Tax=Prunus persica TaxID=3760 RepID=M5WJD2_PRUPE|nr:uncharacterized protein LOC18778465 isoform X1 [Prunus persica]ONI09633.1 hypothetical protein PRUPE_4G001000 [Prunus persica]ONI09634.1 hypothetical protein PRUPE_4G001000 [Prunus persica]
MGMGGAGGGASSKSKLRNAAKKMVVAAANACGSFSRRKALVDPIVFDHTNTTATASISGSSAVSPTTPKNISGEEVAKETEFTIKSNNMPSTSTKNLCAICLDPLSYHSKSSTPGLAIFTAQCSHAFHFACISSNVRHGSVTCPICRAHWTQLPRNLNPPGGSLSSCNRPDPILQILDDSIATFRIHRRSFLRSAHYDDDDPIEPDHMPNWPRLQLSLIPIPPSAPPSWCTPYPYHPSPHHQSCSSSSLLQSPTRPKPFTLCAFSDRAYLSVKLAHQRATDLVLVASPNGPHLRLLKQCMALVVFSLRPIDRLAIVTYSSAAARLFPLRRMTSYGKRTAQQVIDRLFYMGQADPIEGIKKGIKILEDRAYKNPESSILHLSDSPTQSYHAAMSMELPIPVHRFHVGFGFGTSNGFIMHEFEELLGTLIGGIVREVQLRIRIGEEASSRIVRIGELRGGEERKILVELGVCGHICVGYSYIEEGEIDEPFTTGETVVSIGDSKSKATEGAAAASGTSDAIICGRSSSASVETWDYHDPYMARRWAKHLHGYRL